MWINTEDGFYVNLDKAECIYFRKTALGKTWGVFAVFGRVSQSEGYISPNETILASYHTETEATACVDRIAFQAFAPRIRFFHYHPKGGDAL